MLTENATENAIPRRLGGGEGIPFECLNENPSATLSGKKPEEPRTRKLYFYNMHVITETRLVTA